MRRNDEGEQTGTCTQDAVALLYPLSLFLNLHISDTIYIYFGLPGTVREW